MFARGLEQIALAAAVDAGRVFQLAETLSLCLRLEGEPDGAERMWQALLEYGRAYPDGWDYLSEPLRPPQS